MRVSTPLQRDEETKDNSDRENCEPHPPVPRWRENLGAGVSSEEQFEDEEHPVGNEACDDG